MFKIYFPGQRVPKWLLEIKDMEGGEIEAPLKFSGLCFVTVRDGAYYVRDIIGAPDQDVFTCDIDPDLHESKEVMLTGQSPEGSEEYLQVNVDPVMSWGEFAIGGAIVALTIIAYKLF
jgi:hypothetical protein